MTPPIRQAFTLLLLGAISGTTGCATTPEADEATEPAPAQAGPRSVQPGPPGSASRELTPAEAAHRPELPHTEADVRFMQNMIHHHAQALEMARLVPERSEREDIRLLARRIERSQMDEIALMQRWLRARGEEAPEVGPDSHEHHRHHDQHGHRDRHGDHGHHEAHARHGEHDEEVPHLMAGMLTPEQLDRLASASGAEFDRLFVEFMIFHHEGALTMVDELFSVPGSAQDSEIYQFASHVDADQRIEIGRMRRMLSDLR